MKTNIFRVISLAFVMLFLAGKINAQTIELNTVQGQTGSLVTVTMSTPDGLMNVGAMSLYIYVDYTVLTYSSWTAIDPDIAGALVNPFGNMLGISWVASGTSGLDFGPGGIMSFTFNVIDCGDVDLDFNLAICEVVDFDVNPIMISYTNGGVITNSLPLVTWSGLVDTDWGNSANWVEGVVPGCNTDVIIAPSANIPEIPVAKAYFVISSLVIMPGAALTIMGSLNVINDLHLMSDPSGTASLIDNGSLSVGGNTYVDRTYSTTSWHLISSPVDNAQSGIYTGRYLQQYSEGTNSWFDIVPTTDPLIACTGYALWEPFSNEMFTYNGILNSGAKSAMITNTATAPYGWNLLGNPYPSSLDWMMVAAANATKINGAVYYLDAATGMFVSFNGGMGGGSPYVPPMQGFFVSAVNPMDIFIVDNTMRTHNGQNIYYKNDFSNMVTLEVEGNGYTDATYLRFDSEATVDFDGQYDAYKLFSWFNEEVPQIYTNTNGTDLSINVLPEVDAVSVNFKAGVSATYTISADVKDFEYLVLEDLQTGIETNLLKDSYSFEYNINEPAERFMMHFAPLGVSQFNSVNARIYGYNDNIYVNVPEQFEGEIYIINMMGQEVNHVNAQGGMNILAAESGYYLVKVVAENGVMTEKVYVK